MTEDTKGYDFVDDPDAQRWEKIENILQGLSPGYRLAIFRVMPTWCSGFLERLEIDEDEPIDLDYIINQWGGKKLRFRVVDSQGKYRRSVDFDCKSYRPKFRGKTIGRNDEFEDDDLRTLTKNREIVRVAPPPPQPNQGLDLTGLLGMLQKSRKEDLSILKTLLGEKEQSQPAQPGGIQEILAFAKHWKELKAIFGDAEPKGSSDDANLLGTITQALKVLQMPRPAPQMSPPARVVPPNASPAISPLNAPPQRLTAENFKTNVLTMLSSMDDTDRIEAVKGALEAVGIDFDDEEPEEITPEDGDLPSNDDFEPDPPPDSAENIC